MLTFDEKNETQETDTDEFHGVVAEESPYGLELAFVDAHRDLAQKAGFLTFEDLNILGVF